MVNEFKFVVLLSLTEGGSGYCKFSCSKYACPSGRSVTFLEFGMLSRRCTRDSTIFFVCLFIAGETIFAARGLVCTNLPLYDTESAKASRRQLKEAI
ncbi:actin-related protein 8-like isoform X2 [Malus domestica]|uniref:actin-related protein 8-like isoform X2 n=1 Tax=Malus domestica TaxID=3750 RepID=UPI003976E5AF